MIMLRLYRSIIRSKLDYGSFIYASAKPNILQTLDPVHNSALRICSGAFKSSPIISLYAETGEPPLKLRRKQLLLQFYTRSQQLPHSHTSRHINLRTNQNTDHSLTVGNQISRTIQYIGEFQLPVIPYSFSETPRWLLSSTTLCEHFDYPRKRTIQENAPQILKNMFLHHVNEEQRNSTHIFTDGSKNGPNVGCAAVLENTAHTKKLSKYASNYTAELYGIITALEAIEQSNNNNFSIFTDSKSIIPTINHYDSTNPLIQKIQTQIYTLQSAQKTVSICWCPAHVGVQQNETADEAARLIAESEEEPIDVRVPYRDHYTRIKEIIRAKWTEEWSNTTNNKLRTIKDHINPPPESHHRNRKMSVIPTSCLLYTSDAADE